MDSTPPQEPGKEDSVPARWRNDEAVELSGQPAGTPRRTVFLWLLAFLAMSGAIVSIAAWLRPAPKPSFAAVWVVDYRFRPFEAPPFVKQDHQALLDGGYFAKDRIQLKTLATSAASDTVVLYLSGHAFCDAQGQVMLLPADADLAAPQASRPLQEVLQTLAQAPAARKLLILDVCWPLEDPYVGRLDDVAARIADELAAVQDPGRLVLCPCSPGQTALASPELGRSVFGYFLEDGLRGWADYDASNPDRQGLVTAKRLANYITVKVEEWARLALNARQTPVLYGDAGDFPLVALERSKSRSHAARPEIEAYPAWLLDAWKARERWRSADRQRSAPWLDRQVEVAVIHTDRSWRNGGSPDTLKKDLTEELDRLEKYFERITRRDRPLPLSLAEQHLREKPPDEALKPVVKDLFKKVVEARLAATKPEEGEKAAAKWIDEFVEKQKQLSDFDWSWAIFQHVASEAFPRRDTVQLGARLIALRQGEKKYAEADLLARLAKLADRYDEAAWPAALARKAILLTLRGEEAASLARAFVWLADPLEAAAQKHRDAELMLFARGYVSLQIVEPMLADALRDTEAILAQANAIDAAHRLVQDALAILPGHVAYLDHNPAADAAWRETAQAARDLQSLLPAPQNAARLTSAERNARIEELKQKTQTLRDALARLNQFHAAATMDDLFIRAGRPDADVKLVRELDAQLQIPLHEGKVRARIWQVRSALARKLTDKIFDEDRELPPRSAPSEFEQRQQLLQARTERAARAARSLALLRLTEMPADDLAAIEVQLHAFAAVQGAEQDKRPHAVRDGCGLAVSLREAWAQQLARQAMEADLYRQETISRVAAPWLRLGAKEEGLARAAIGVSREQDGRLLAWRADRFRHESAEPWATPFVTQAAFALREFAPPVAGLTLPATPSRVEITAAKPRATIRVPLHWSSLPKNTPPVSVRILTADDEWLQIVPHLDSLKALDDWPRDQAGAVEIPIEVSLKPQAELSASPRPLGFLVRFEAVARAYHHVVELPALPSAERLEIIVSADPKDPSIPLGDLRLRPGRERQAFYVYVNNRGKALRNLTVELRAGDRVLPGGAATIAAPPEQTTRVVFGAPAAPVKEPSPPAVAKIELLPELLGPVQIAVQDKDRKNEQVAMRELRVEIADPREYVRVPEIRFEPASKENAGKNRLEVTVQAVRKLRGPPCAVELVIPRERIPGLRAVRGGVFRGELPMDGSALKLSASEFEFDLSEGDTGPVYLHVDGVERAFIFRTTFAPVGEATIPREELRPALRLSAGHYFRTNTRFEAIAEVDHAPALAQLQVSIGQFRGGAFVPEIRKPFLSAREKRIGIGIRGADGGVEFDTRLGDRHIPFDAVPVRGERVVETRLIDPQGMDLAPPAYHTVVFDDRIPDRVAFIDLPKAVKRDVPIVLKATGIDQGTGIREVSFFLGKPTDDGKLPTGAVKLEARPSPTEANVWLATMHWPADKKGPVDVSVQFMNRLDFSAFARGTVELLDIDPLKNAPGSIEGTVVEGARPQEGVVVTLYDAKGNKLAEQKTQAGGAFAFANVAPGAYTVRAVKPTSGTPLIGSAKVNLAPGKTERLKIELFL